MKHLACYVGKCGYTPSPLGGVAQIVCHGLRDVGIGIYLICVNIYDDEEIHYVTQEDFCETFEEALAKCALLELNLN